MAAWTKMSEGWEKSDLNIYFESRADGKKCISSFLYVNLQGISNWYEKHNQALNLVSRLI